MRACIEVRMQSVTGVGPRSGASRERVTHERSLPPCGDLGKADAASRVVLGFGPSCVGARIARGIHGAADDRPILDAR
jgi:hypothetical protein